MREIKGSAEVVEFMALLARLKDWFDNSPDNLADMADPASETSARNSRSLPTS